MIRCTNYAQYVSFIKCKSVTYDFKVYGDINNQVKLDILLIWGK